MLIRTLRDCDLSENDVTDKSLFDQRRKFLKTAAFAGAGTILAPSLLAEAALVPQKGKLSDVAKHPYYRVTEEQTPYDAVTKYNNFYEFGTGKEDPAENAHTLQPRPWTVKVDGLVKNGGDYDFEDLVKPHALEERIYRFRCVEAWSMVIPWVGIPLADMIKRFEPEGSAKYISFETLYDPKQMPGQLRMVLQWPYREGLRLDEAMHPLSFMAVGLYGEVLPNQNGAPIRLVVPWKYGFKSIKSIVRISFTETMPQTSWNMASPREYGFYSNVNPEVSHPRWSQAKERRIGEFLKRDTLMLNGYADEVGSLYSGLDMKANY